MYNITALELLNVYNNNPITIIDVRDKLDYSHKHIPNSYNIPYDFLLNSCLTYLNKDKTYYIICENGILSMKAATYLDKLGYKIINVQNGISSWIGPTTN